MIQQEPDDPLIAKGAKFAKGEAGNQSCGEIDPLYREDAKIAIVSGKESSRSSDRVSYRVRRGSPRWEGKDMKQYLPLRAQRALRLQGI
jgi:hypothetical protein